MKIPRDILWVDIVWFSLVDEGPKVIRLSHQWLVMAWSLAELLMPTPICMSLTEAGGKWAGHNLLKNGIALEDTT